MKVPAALRCVLIAAISLVPVLPAHAQRVALLIGNASYNVGRLSNPPSDVREMESALKAVGFTVQTVLNANQNAMKRAVRDFGSLAQGADIAFLYYSGHGTQVQGENYLIPVQANIDKEADYEVEAVSANAIMRQLAGARPKAAIVVLDACRDNPLAATTRTTSKGLSRMDAPTGTMIAFSTAPNTTATDDGIYARTLARQIRTPGLEIVDVFRNTTAEVRKATGGKQEPRLSEMSITDRIYLSGSLAGQAPIVQAAAQVATQPRESGTASQTRPSMVPSPDGATGASTRARSSWIWPHTGPILSAFDDVKSKGVDIGGAAGDAVVAVADGRVVYAGSGLRGYGNLIILSHDSGYLTTYAHNSMLLVKENQTVKVGEKIAEIGSSDTDRVKLHFEIRKNGKPVDPMEFLPPR